MTCQRNTDYSASKFALCGFVESLRYELLEANSPVKMTNFYPYYINTGFFAGFKPRLAAILPTLDAEYTARRMCEAVMAEEEEVYIRGVIYWLKIVLLLLPGCIRRYAVEVLVGEGMRYFEGRVE